MSETRICALSELVPYESSAAVVQDRRAPYSACPILHSPAGRNPVDSALVRTDHTAHRAARVAPDV